MIWGLKGQRARLVLGLGLTVMLIFTKTECIIRYCIQKSLPIKLCRISMAMCYWPSAGSVVTVVGMAPMSRFSPTSGKT